MPGARPFSKSEISVLLNSFKNKRDKALFVFGYKSGFRISELLSIKVNQVVQFGQVSESVTVNRNSMKGKVNSRTIVLHSEVKIALIDMGVLEMNPNDRLFPIGRIQGHRILKEAFAKAKLMGKVSSHSLRKTFCQGVYEKLGKDLRKTQIATGHKNLNNLAYYLQYDQQEIDKAILGD